MRPLAPTKALQYIRSLYAHHDTLLEEIHESLVIANQPIHIGPEEGKFLQLLITMTQARNILEIGTLYGYSTIWMGRALAPDGKIISLEKEEECVHRARGYCDRAGLGSKIEIIQGDAIETLKQFSNASLDMIFIDADKISYGEYLNHAERLLRPGGLLVADNTLLFDSVYEEEPTEGIRQTTWETMRSFNEALADSTRFLSVLLPTKEGLTLAIKH